MTPLREISCQSKIKERTAVSRIRRLVNHPKGTGRITKNIKTHGATTLTLIFLAAISLAALLDRPTTPCLLAEYAAWPLTPRMPATLAQLTTEPPSRMARSCSRWQTMTPVRLIAMMRSQSESSMLAAVVAGSWPVMPAMLAPPVKLPNLSTVESIQALTWVLDRTSAVTASRLPSWPPLASMALVARCRAFSSMSEMDTFAPWEMRSFAVASPIPDAPPLMAMTFPENGLMVE